MGEGCGEERPIVPQLFCPVSLMRQTSALSEDRGRFQISEFGLKETPIAKGTK